MFSLKFNTSNSAFYDDYINDIDRNEISRILHVVSTQIENGYNDGSIMDINGNKIGEYKLEI